MKNSRKNLVKTKKHISKNHNVARKYMSKKTNLSKKNKNIKHKNIKHKNTKRKNTKRKNIKNKSRKYKGGYGLGTNPFPQHPGAWNVDNMGNYFLFNPHGQATGGQDPFFGVTHPEPQLTYSAFKSGLTPFQKGGMFGQGLVNLYRNSMNNLVNNSPFLGKVYRGKQPIVSPSPSVQPAMETNVVLPAPLPNIKDIRNNSKTLASKF